ncbi:response regulator transcription factor [Oscillatoria sp. CS-180]|uniref:helix-turn-helix transcriptional regulator n=1 Tax=Oscillatoria sp. CS-180 TaxID=3021720 RepID=UPI0023314EA1|nr:response regulator transcription factor [Oscillatoria sp. CS-180]MDB9526138.1 response regulator transcription factor [Oscillatoria sp. CS-180]
MAQVVICAENSVTRAGLAAMATIAGVEIVDQMADLKQLISGLQTQPADLVLLALPELSHPTAQALVQLVTEWPFETTLSVLLLLGTWDPALSQTEDEAPSLLHQRLSGLVKTGGVSILPLTVSVEQVRGAIAAILTGSVVLYPELAEVISLADGSSAKMHLEIHSPIEPLTPREIEVLNQLAAGLSNRAIADELMISEHTVKFHISAILSKLNVASRTEAVTVGIRAGLVMI